MKTSLSRRDWFKSTVALSAGFALSASMFDRAMAAPMSVAEMDFYSKAVGGKVRLNANENPYGPSEKARKAILDSLSEANRYPFGAIGDLKEILAKKEGVTKDYIHIGAGSSDLLCQTGAAFGIEGGRILSGFPTFWLLQEYAEVFGATWD